MRAGLVILLLAGCGGDGGGPGGGPDGAPDDGAPPNDSAAQNDTTSGGASYEDVVAWIDAYKMNHPGNGGMDWDINTKGPAEIAADPALQDLLGLCGDYNEQRPVIPLLAWEYGGLDHQWINPDQSALVYCDYIPVSPSTANWAYDAVADHVTADVWVLFPEHNPCGGMAGAAQVEGCIGDPSNFEILVDIASLDDGVAAGLNLAEASTELMYLMSDGNRVHLYTGL